MSRDRRLMLERIGAGEPRVIALHGWGRGREDWIPVLSGIGSLVPDLPGFGVNAAPPEVWGAREYAKYLLPLLDEADRPILVGHSFGGRIAACMAAMAPEKVCGLVLTGAPLIRTPGPRRSHPMFRLAKSLNNTGLVPDRVLERARYRYGSADYRAATGIMRQILVKVVNETYEDDLLAVKAPTALVWGAQDSAVPVAVAEAASELMASATLEVVDAAGHHLQGTLGDRVRAAVVKQVDAPCP
jgi:pimeloyl-ACP methyl ester carboxylesterase